MADQATFKWGGRFSTIDMAIGKPVTGSVFGTFGGKFPAEQQPILAAQFLRSFQDILAGQRTPLAELTADLPTLTARLTKATQAQVKEAGASGSVTIAMVKLV